MEHLINNIKSVSYIEANQLIESLPVKNSGIILINTGSFSEIPTIGLSSCEINEEISNNVTVYDIKLTMRCCSRFDVKNRKLCFKIKNVMGDEFLIGTAFAPYCKVLNAEDMPADVTAKSGVNVVVTLRTTVPLLVIM